MPDTLTAVLPPPLSTLSAWERQAAWRPWLRCLCAVVGGSLLLAGIICFFAFNWAAMPAWTKFALIEGGLALCLLLAWKAGPASPAGAYLICAASVLVGVFLAVFGQVYQTGADAWQLFALWTALIAPWTLVARNAAQWCLLLVLGNLTVWTWYGAPFLLQGAAGMYLALLCLNGLALLGREVALHRGASWLAPRWTGLAPAALLLATGTVTVFLWQWGEPLWRSSLYPEYLGLLGVACLVGAGVFFVRQGDVARSGLLALCGFPLANELLLVGVLGHQARLDERTFASFCLLNVGYAILATRALRVVARRGRATVSAGEGENRPTARPAATSPVILCVHCLGGVLAAVFLCGFIVLLTRASFPLGIALLAAGLGLYRLPGGVGHAGMSFCLALVAVGVGFCLSVSDWKMFWTPLWTLALILAVVYAALPLAPVRYTCVLLWLTILTGRIVREHGLTPALVLTLACGLPLAVRAAWRSPLVEGVAARLVAWITPALYAMVSIFVLLVVPGTGGDLADALVDGRMPRVIAYARAGMWFAAAVLAILFVTEARAVARRGERTGSGPWLAFGLVLAALLCLGATGVLVGIALLAVGHGRGDRTLTLLGIVFFPVFLFLWYYSLQTSLLIKSFVLMGSGLALLAALRLLRDLPDGRTS